MSPSVEETREVAVVDIGSNSVRLAVYRIEGGAIWTIFNEKVLAGLGRGVAGSGQLSEEGVETALRALTRFAGLIGAMKPSALHVFATAAVRDAEDGPAFVERVAAETGLQVRVLSGEEEARFSARGVVAGAPDTRGVVGDLGGASLELSRVGSGRIETGVTLPLGPFSLTNGKGVDADRLRKTIARTLAPVARDFAGPGFHAVGGAWRSLAQLHMATADYPLKIVHQYAMTAEEAREVAGVVGRQSKASLDKLPGVSRRRAETLPVAALVLEGLIEALGIETVTFSAWGVREGVLVDGLDLDPDSDPLLAGAAVLAARQGVSPGLPDALHGFVVGVTDGLPPVFGAKRDAVLTRAACLYADIGGRFHPDHRSDLAFDQVLRAPLAGQSHAERVFLAGVINARHGGGAATPDPRLAQRVLSEAGIHRARVLGLAIRLGSDLSARSPRVLEGARLRLGDGSVSLSHATPSVLGGETVSKRLRQLADCLGVEPRLEEGDQRWA
ncbi:Ppx/GppA family phosphatase [Brevundimonas sp.]|uniref:Ppx/GppA phosphatase family protein n=1 Tax=Brevundimonas sp. TaxID=1871086 RepID=UPI0035AF0DE1